MCQWQFNWENFSQVSSKPEHDVPRTVECIVLSTTPCTPRTEKIRSPCATPNSTCTPVSFNLINYHHHDDDLRLL